MCGISKIVQFVIIMSDALHTVLNLQLMCFRCWLNYKYWLEETSFRFAFGSGISRPGDEDGKKKHIMKCHTWLLWLLSLADARGNSSILPKSHIVATILYAKWDALWSEISFLRLFWILSDSTARQILFLSTRRITI